MVDLGVPPSEEASSCELVALLKQVFGYDQFRPMQREIVLSTLSGRDSLAILPTGAGKSICYQLPALLREGSTLVVSPLIALMKDQVDQLESAGVSAAFLNSSLEPSLYRQRMQELAAGRYKLVYLAPERLAASDFLRQIEAWRVAAIAIDEAHCISAWGHDFRPDYRNLHNLRRVFPHVPLLALTATATPRVREDIIAQLRLQNPAVFVSSFNRPNLSYRVIPKEKPAQQILEFCLARKDECGIVYCQSRKSCETLSAVLRQSGLASVYYHAGMDGDERTKSQEAFLKDEAKIVCATVAFGMGINKPNVRYVLHADLPKNVEGYYQETGRAGRDGLPAECLLLFSNGDTAKLLRFIDDVVDPQARQVARRQLDQMVAYAEEHECRRAHLLQYFGENWLKYNCGACDNCLEPPEPWDATLESQKFLSCIYRISQRNGMTVGLRTVADVLMGAQQEKLAGRGFNSLSTFGIGKDKSKEEWLSLGRQLIHQGLAAASEGERPTLRLTEQGLHVLKQRSPVTLFRRTPATEGSRTSKRSLSKSGEVDCDEGLFALLRKLRKRLADERNVPAYVVFSDVTLRHIARSYPQSRDDFLEMPGVGGRKLAEFADEFIAEVKHWLLENPQRAFGALSEGVRQASVKDARANGPGPALSGTVLVTLHRFRVGESIEQIASTRGFTVSTIEGHLVEAILAGEALPREKFFSEAEEEEIRQAFEGMEESGLTPVFAKLNGRISYGKLRIFKALANLSRSGNRKT